MMLVAGLLLGITSVHAALPVALQLSADDNKIHSTAWPVVSPLPPPQGLRPCCAFGYDLHAQVLDMPLPFYELDNVVATNSIGNHRYNDSLLLGLINLLGIGGEHNGIVYTSHGGFIDTAHVRDTADMTVWLFSHLYAQLGQSFTLRPGDELAERHVVFRAFTPPTAAADRYALAAWLAAHLAFQLAAWHEIAQWYGFESIPGFSEEVSAFSPEDLYSNLLGARIAVSLILDGQLATMEMYDAAMTNALPQALVQLGAKPEKITRFQFDMLDGKWWNSQRRVPEKYLVLHRNYDVSDSRLPTPVPGEHASPLRLTLPHHWRGYTLDALAQLQLWPGSSMAHLPSPNFWYNAADFAGLAKNAGDSEHSLPVESLTGHDG
ncbi:DUF4056 domain-containing protein [Citrobacter koseri]|uniref:DUF4056 domain-containing protein n=1 Tax=Citrobacter koseri TaxID=545 RepID=UPI0024B7AB6D|nr:DUF4056 domain-containing protein [Citrobacter koseri]MDI9802752.1 DUF4056 domain-containing protein [Citrobacter koseri]